jgi:hypothetical protein
VIDIPIGELLPNKPIKVGGVIYADGTEDGEANTLKTMHGHKKHDESQSLVKKGGSQQ